METATAPNMHRPVIRALAHIISVIFHPLFIASYVAAFLVYIHPYAFAGVGERWKFFKLLTVVFNTAFIPAFAVFLMWRLRLVESIYLRTQRDRMIPYLAVMICFFWAWWVSRNQPDNPPFFVEFLLGSFLAICASWMANIYVKVSMHTTAAGGLVVFFLLQAFSPYDTTGVYFSIALLVAGLIGTARLIISNHSPGEVYLGYILGAVSQLVATVVI